MEIKYVYIQSDSAQLTQFLRFQFVTRCTKPSQKGSRFPNRLFRSSHSTVYSRIFSNLQGGGRWLRSHGFHWLHRQVDPHTHVRNFQFHS